MVTHDEIVNAVRKFVNKDICNTEGLIDYLDKHTIISSDVFRVAFDKRIDFDSVRKEDTAKFRMLLNFRSIGRDIQGMIGYFDIDTETFLKRMPYYFYYSTQKYGYKDFTELAFVYADYKAINGMLEIRSDESEWDLLYEMLDFLYYECHLSLKDIFSYPTIQTGSKTRFDIFVRLYQYFKVCKEIGKNVVELPKNILYSYNLVLEEAGKKPIVYIPDYSYGEKGFVRHNDVIELEGELPYDPVKNELITRWIGMWGSDIGEITFFPLQKSDIFSDEIVEGTFLHVTMKIKVKPNTILYFADFPYGEDIFEPKIDALFEDNQNEGPHDWIPAFIGPQVLKFDFNRIKEKREDFKYTQKEIASMIQTSVRTYQNWETKTTLPDAGSLIKLMALLDIDDVTDLIASDAIEDENFDKFLTGADIRLFLPRDDN